MTTAMTRIRSLLTLERGIDAGTLAVSLGLADQLYQFHRFSLEAIAFLATWYVFRAAARFVAGMKTP